MNRPLVRLTTLMPAGLEHFLVEAARRQTEDLRELVHRLDARRRLVVAEEVLRDERLAPVDHAGERRALHRPRLVRVRHVRVARQVALAHVAAADSAVHEFECRVLGRDVVGELDAALPVVLLGKREHRLLHRRRRDARDGDLHEALVLEEERAQRRGLRVERVEVVLVGDARQTVPAARQTDRSDHGERSARRQRRARAARVREIAARDRQRVVVVRRDAEAAHREVDGVRVNHASDERIRLQRHVEQVEPIARGGCGRAVGERERREVRVRRREQRADGPDANGRARRRVGSGVRVRVHRVGGERRRRGHEHDDLYGRVHRVRRRARRHGRIRATRRDGIDQRQRVDGQLRRRDRRRGGVVARGPVRRRRGHAARREVLGDDPGIVLVVVDHVDEVARRIRIGREVGEPLDERAVQIDLEAPLVAGGTLAIADGHRELLRRVARHDERVARVRRDAEVRDHVRAGFDGDVARRVVRPDLIRACGDAAQVQRAPGELVDLHRVAGRQQRRRRTRERAEPRLRGAAPRAAARGAHSRDRPPWRAAAVERQRGCDFGAVGDADTVQLAGTLGMLPEVQRSIRCQRLRDPATEQLVDALLRVGRQERAGLAALEDADVGGDAEGSFLEGAISFDFLHPNACPEDWTEFPLSHHAPPPLVEGGPKSIAAGSSWGS
jgi:hypothetical protein